MIILLGYVLTTGMLIMCTWYIIWNLAAFKKTSLRYLLWNAASVVLLITMVLTGIMENWFHLRLASYPLTLLAGIGMFVASYISKREEKREKQAHPERFAYLKQLSPVDRILFRFPTQ